MKKVEDYRAHEFASAKFGVRPPQRPNCSINGGRRYHREVPFCHVESPFPQPDCLNNGPYLGSSGGHTRRGRGARRVTRFDLLPRPG
jgi:hypothetical protein